MDQKIKIEEQGSPVNRAYHFQMPGNLYRRARTMAADRDLTMKEFIISALLAEVNRCEAEYAQRDQPRTDPTGKIIM